MYSITHWLLPLQSCLLLACSLRPQLTAAAEATLDPGTGVITCNYPEERENCVMPYKSTNTT